MKIIIKHLHLGLSAIVVILAAVVYGVSPSNILPWFFDFSTDNLELKNILRAIMGLYLGFALYWIIGIKKAKYWRSATLSNIIFMGGLAFGRAISTMLDGISPQFTIGMVLELIMMIWGLYNYKRLN